MNLNLRRIGAGFLLSASSGFMMLMAFPPYRIWPLVFIAWVPLVVAQYRVVPPKLTGMTSALAVFIWLQGYLGPVFRPVGNFMVFLPAFVALITLLTDQGLRKTANLTGNRLLILQGVSGWGVGEMIRLFIPIAGTWAFVAYPLYRQPWLIQPVSVFGIIGMGMVIMLVNYGLGLNAVFLYDRFLPLPGSEAGNVPIAAALLKKSNLVCGLVAVAWVAMSLIQYQVLKETYGAEAATGGVAVAAVQPQASPIITANAKDAQRLEAIYRDMMAQTRKAAAAGARFVVWPEGTFLWDPQVRDPYGLPALARQENIYLALGYVVILEDGRLRNEATIISPEGRFLGVFGKDHPVRFSGETSVTGGTYPVYETSLGNLGTIICYDLDYTDTTRKLVRNGAQLVGVPSNDWAGIAELHYTHVVFRAVENRVAMVKADGGFDSVIVTPLGDIVDLAVHPEGGAALAAGKVPLGNGRGTVNTVLGDWAGWLALLLVITAEVWVRRAKKRRAGEYRR